MSVNKSMAAKPTPADDLKASLGAAKVDEDEGPSLVPAAVKRKAAKEEELDLFGLCELCSILVELTHSLCCCAEAEPAEDDDAEAAKCYVRAGRCRLCSARAYGSRPVSRLLPASLWAVGGVRPRLLR